MSTARLRCGGSMRFSELSPRSPFAARSVSDCLKPTTRTTRAGLMLGLVPTLGNDKRAFWDARANAL